MAYFTLHHHQHHQKHGLALFSRLHKNGSSRKSTKRTKVTRTPLGDLKIEEQHATFD